MSTSASVLVFTVPMPENVTNRRSGGGNWWSSYRDKTAYWARLDLLQHYSRKAKLNPAGGFYVPQPPVQPFARVAVRSLMQLGGAMDDDNAMARHKPLLDWLRKRGYLADDRKKNITWEGLPEQVIKRDGKYRIVLTLTEMSSGVSR